MRATKQSIKINPNDAEALLLNYGNALKNYGEFEHSNGELAIQALKINPYHADAHYNMGNALKEKGELDASVESYEMQGISNQA